MSNDNVEVHQSIHKPILYYELRSSLDLCIHGQQIQKSELFKRKKDLAIQWLGFDEASQ